MTEATRVPAASLLRVSTAAQAADGTSLETQSRANREFISARGRSLAGEYVEREGVSGAAAERGDVDRLLRDIRAGLVQVVVVNKVDRFVRDARQFHNTIAEIEGAGALFVSATEGFDGSTASGRMHRSMLAVIAAFERDRIRERTQDGVRETVRMGFWPGGEPRFGLRTVKDRHSKHKRVVVHRAEAATVNLATGLLVDEGLDMAQAAARLNALSHKPRRAGRWDAALLRAALSGDGLCGSWTYSGPKRGRRAPKGEAITIAVPPVLSPERHAALAEVLRATSRRVGPSGFYLLSHGRLVSPCGRNYHGTERNDREVRAYRCSGGASGCGCRRLHAGQVEDAVWGAVVDLLSHPDRLLASAEAHLAERGRRLGVEREEAARVAARMAEVQRALTTTIRDYAKKGLPADAVSAATAELQEELDSLRSHRDELARWERADLDEAARSKSLWRVARLASDRLRHMPEADRDRILELLRVRVDVEGWEQCGECEGRGKLPGRRGGYRCGRCRGLRQIASVHVQGVFIDRLADVLDGSPVHFGNNCGAAAYRGERDQNGLAGRLRSASWPTPRGTCPASCWSPGSPAAPGAGAGCRSACPPCPGPPCSSPPPTPTRPSGPSSSSPWASPPASACGPGSA
jgi:DNA invertase Pin-like site-specific DNA recombinase